jgi:glycosyltransferase involved in cell wall biosynthesis
VTPRTRIVYVIGTLERGGAETQLVELAARLDPARFEPTVCCLAGGGPLAATLAARGVPVQIVAVARGCRRLRAALGFWRLLRRLRPDVVHGHLYWGNVAAALGGRLVGVPAVVGSRRNLGGPPRPLRAGLRRLANSWTHLVIANSAVVRDAARGDEGLPEDRLLVIHNGVDVSRFDVAPDPRLRDSLSLPGSGPIVTVVAHLRRSKGHPVFLRAWASLVRALPQARALLVGGGPLREELENRAAALGVRDSVRFLGVRDDVPALLALTDVVAHASLREGFPNAVLEALAARRPVVATDAGGTREAIVHGRTGLLVPPRDAGALEAGLVRLLSNPDEARALGEAGRRHVTAHFQISTMVRAHEAAYERILADSRRRLT